MKPLHLILAVTLVTVAVSLTTSLLVTDSDDGSQASWLVEKTDLMGQLQDAAAEIDILKDAMGKMDARLRRTEETDPGVQALRVRRELQARIDQLEDEIALLKQRSTPILTGDAAEPKVVAALETQLDSVVKKKFREQQKRQFAVFKPFIKRGFTRGFDRAARKLKLNPEQKERLKKAADKAFEKVAPQLQVLFDPQAAPEEKSAAIAEVEASVEEVGTDAESYLTPEQMEQFNQMQQQSLQGIQQMQAMFGGGASGGGGAGSGSGN